MVWHDLALVIIGFFSELLGTLSGFGSSTFFVPAALFFEKLQFVLALTALLHCFGNVSKLVLFKVQIDRALFLKLAVPSVFLTGLGAVLSKFAPVDLLQRFLGVVLVVLSLLALLRSLRLRNLRDGKPERAHAALGIVLTAASGFCTGLIGTGGAIRGLALSFLRLEKNSFVSLSAAIDLGGDVTRAGIYLYNGYLDLSQWFYLPLLGVAAALGAWCGRKILSRFSQTQFEKTVAVFVFLSGVAMILRT
jgi:uncharacterized protein